jgi:hypothetical protein
MACVSLAHVALPRECAVIRDRAFSICGALKGIDLGYAEELGEYAFGGCYSLSRVGAVSRIRKIGDSALQATAAVEFEFETLSHVGWKAFAGSCLRMFSGYVDAWGDRPFDNCRDLRRLEIWPGRGFDPLQLVGHVPDEIRFHGGLGQANEIFGDLLQGSGTPVVVTADTTQIIGGAGSALARGTKSPRIAVTSPHLTEDADVAIKAVDLSGLLPDGLHYSLGSCIWVETVTLPTWLETLPGKFFRDCRSLRAVNLADCRQLGAIDEFCFEGCVSLRALAFPDALSSVGFAAFASSGLEALNLVHAKGLANVDAFGAHWLATMRLPLRLRGLSFSHLACRVVEVSGGLCDMSGLPGRLRLFRCSAARGPGDDPSCCLVEACVRAELAAAAGRSSAPVLPC